jgi:hypothetical protein
MVEIVEVVVDLPERIGPRARLAINSHRPELPVRRVPQGTRDGGDSGGGDGAFLSALVLESASPLTPPSRAPRTSVPWGTWDGGDGGSGGGAYQRSEENK